MGSIASASVAKGALSETSKKGVAADSPEIDYLRNDHEQNEMRNLEMMTRGYTTSDMDESSYESSYFASFLKTDESSDEQNEDHVSYIVLQFEVVFTKKKFVVIQKMEWDKFRRGPPPWMEKIAITSDLIYKYQLEARSSVDVLKQDRSALKKLHQVNFI